LLDRAHLELGCNVQVAEHGVGDVDVDRSRNRRPAGDQLQPARLHVDLRRAGGCPDCGCHRILQLPLRTTRLPWTEIA